MWRHASNSDASDVSDKRKMTIYVDEARPWYEYQGAMNDGMRASDHKVPSLYIVKNSIKTSCFPGMKTAGSSVHATLEYGDGCPAFSL